MVAGIGCRAGVSGEEVLAAIAAAMGELRNRQVAEALRAAPMNQHPTLTAIAAPTSKTVEPGVRAAATARGVPLIAIAQTDLEAANAATVTRSARSMTAMNVHSVAEAAALAGAIAMAENMCAAPTVSPHPVPTAAAAGAAPTRATARLLLPRIIVGPVTCALASLTP